MLIDRGLRQLRPPLGLVVGPLILVEPVLDANAVASPSCYHASGRGPQAIRLVALVACVVCEVGGGILVVLQVAHADPDALSRGDILDAIGRLARKAVAAADAGQLFSHVRDVLGVLGKEPVLLQHCARMVVEGLRARPPVTTGQPAVLFEERGDLGLPRVGIGVAKAHRDPEGGGDVLRPCGIDVEQPIEEHERRARGVGATEHVHHQLPGDPVRVPVLPRDHVAADMLLDRLYVHSSALREQQVHDEGC
mmetsp:Transcript_23836/g.68650  ORF Transcript_23836/g.68650 Transcript_23836/m.68650 type:complete len:251 (+) Transcript_23836:1104-1856(+)